MKNTLIKWHIKKLVVVIMMCLLPVILSLSVVFGANSDSVESKSIAGIAIIIPSIIIGYFINKKWYCCPHCEKMIDLDLHIREDTRCPHCGEYLVDD